MTRSRSLATIGLLIVLLVGAVSGTCTQCGAIRIGLECPMGPSSAPVEGTAGLICDVIKDKAANFTCQVDSLHTGKAISYIWLNASTDSSKDKPISDETNKTISYNVTADILLKCKANVSDIYGTVHTLLSNIVSVKAQNKVAAVSVLTGTETIANETVYTELKCTIPTTWYPEPDVLWEKDGKPGTPDMLILNKDFGPLKKGSLILHGVSSNLTGQYTCSLMYKYRHAMSKELEPMRTLAANYTVKTASGTLVASKTTGIFSGKGAIWPSYTGPGTPVIFNCLAVGGDTGGTKPRVHYRWYRVGSDYGIKVKNITNTNCKEDGKDGEEGGKKEKRHADKGGDEKEGPDPCWFISTNTTNATVELDPMNMEKYGVEAHPHGQWISFKAAYSEINATYKCAVSLNNTSTATNYSFTPPTMLGGMGVDTGTTCGYTSDAVPLPLMDYMTNYTANMQPHMALPDYTAFSVYKNGTELMPPKFSAYKVNDLTIKSLAAPAGGASKCQYYQVMRTISGVSVVVKTILVQNLGAKGSNVYNASKYIPARPNITVPVDTNTTITATCSVSGNGSVAEWVTDCPRDVYTLIEQSANSNCDWMANITFDRTIMQGACKAMCMFKSQCTRVEGIPFTAMPSSCPVNSVPNAKMFMKEDDMSGKRIFANDIIMPECEPGYQLNGPSMIKCGTDGALSSSATGCTDVSKVKCPTLEAGKGSLTCTVSTVSACTYTCQSNAFFSNGTALVSSKKVTCNAATAAWSHMSKDNPTGNLPTCAGTKTPSGILTTATVEVSGTATCPSNAKAKAAVIVTFKASSDTDYDCIDSGTCEVATVTCTTSGSSAINLKIVVNQTKSTTDASISTKLGAQLKADAVAKTFSISVDLSKRKRAATTLKATGTVSVATSSSCPSGSGSVGTKCITCAAGTYVNNGVCTSCPLHTYSSAEGQTVCTDCPSGLKTFAVGQDSETDCSASTCEIATIANGITSPTSGWTVKSSTIVTTFCNANYSVGFEKEMKNECGSTARCSKMCEIHEVAKAKKFTDAALKEGVRIDQGAEASLICDSEKTVSQICKDGDELEFSCSGSKVALVVGLCCVALLVVVALVMSAVVVNKRNKRPESPGTPPPLPKRRKSTPPPELTFFDKLVGTAKMVPVNIERKMSVAD